MLVKIASQSVRSTSGFGREVGLLAHLSEPLWEREGRSAHRCPCWLMQEDLYESLDCSASTMLEVTRKTAR